MAHADPVHTRRRLRRAPEVRRSLGEVLFDNLNVLLMFAFAFMTLYPFWYVLVLSLNEGRDAALGGIWFLPRKWSLNNFAFVILKPIVLSAYKITILRTASGSLLTLLVCRFAAYALTKHQLPGRNALITSFLIPMFIGGTVVSYYGCSPGWRCSTGSGSTSCPAASASSR